MDDRSSTSARTSRVVLELHPGRVEGRWPAGKPESAAIVLDETVQAILPADPAGFTWRIPPHLFGRLLDVRAVADGASLLAAPADLAAVRRVHWDEWTLSGERIGGTFSAAGDAAVLPVALVAEGVRHAQGFAHRQNGRYVVALPLQRLPAGVGGLQLQPEVGGLLLDPALHLPADALAFVGVVEPSEPWRVRGWALERAEPGRRVTLEIWLDGVRVRTLVADQAREDVGALGFGDGFNGFDVALSAPLDRAVRVDVRVASGPSLGGSPFLRSAAPRYVGWFDGVDGFSAGGWALDLAEPGRAVTVQALCDGAAIGTGLADLHRGDVVEAGLPHGRCGFHLLLERPASELVGRAVTLVIADAGLTLQGSPRVVTLNPNAAAFFGQTPPRPAALARLRRRLSHATRATTISIVMPVHETREDWLRAAIGSVAAQWSDGWELICVDDGSEAAHVAVVLAEAAADPRVRVIRRWETGGIARAVNEGLRAARGDYVAFLDHDDALEPDAVFHLAQTAQATGAGLIYSDEVLTGPSLDQVVQHRARPAWSHDYYLSHPYFVHLVAVRRELALSIGGYDETMAISADVDFVLRTAERAERVAHVPRVLYRWRTHPGSTGHARQGEVMTATAGAIGRHVRRLGWSVGVQPGLGFNQFRIDWPDDGGMVLIVIPTRDRVDLLRRCIESVERTVTRAQVRIVVVDHQSEDPATVAYLRASPHHVLPYEGPFNFAAMNNAAVAAHGGGADYLLFLNNDVEAIGPGWLERLRSLAGRAAVGAVGPMLLYGNGKVQHAGVIVGIGAAADHAMRFAEPTGPDGKRNGGYNASLTSTRDFSAVTAACLLTRRTAFEQVGGFDERFPVGFNDTDLCLRLRAAGLAVLYDGQTTLLHHESATRVVDRALANPEGDEARFKARWPHYADGADPFYNPSLATRGPDHRLRDDAIRPSSLVARVRPAIAVAPESPASRPRRRLPKPTVPP